MNCSKPFFFLIIALSLSILANLGFNVYWILKKVSISQLDSRLSVVEKMLETKQ